MAREGGGEGRGGEERLAGGGRWRSSLGGGGLSRSGWWGEEARYNLVMTGNQSMSVIL